MHNTADSFRCAWLLCCQNIELWYYWVILFRWPHSIRQVHLTNSNSKFQQKSNLQSAWESYIGKRCERFKKFCSICWVVRLWDFVADVFIPSAVALIDRFQPIKNVMNQCLLWKDSNPEIIGLFLFSVTLVWTLTSNLLNDVMKILYLVCQFILSSRFELIERISSWKFFSSLKLKEVWSNLCCLC